MSNDVTIDEDPIIRRLLDAWAQTQQILNRKFAKEITSNKWDWPIDPSPRDIVDTGELRRSYKLTKLSDMEYEHGWYVPYALPVHEGYVTRSGRAMPARPWTKEVLKEDKILETLKRVYRRMERSGGDT